jgi:hypothetical protein
MTDDKTPTVGGFNAAQAQALNNTAVPSYTSLRRRAADGIVTSNVAYPSRSGGAGAGSNAFQAQGGGGGTLRPGQSVRQLRGFPDIEEAIGQGQSAFSSRMGRNRLLVLIVVCQEDLRPLL